MRAKQADAPRSRDPEEARHKLLDAARALFAERGLHGTSVHDIARAAELSASMINHHFGGKEALYRACLGDFAERRLLVLDKYLVPPRSAEEFTTRLDVLVHELLDLHLEHRPIVAILMRDIAISEVWGAPLERRLFEFSERLAEVFALAQRAGVLRGDVDPAIASSIVYLTLHGFVQNEAHLARVSGLSLGDREVRRALVGRLLDTVLHGVLVPATASARPRRKPG